MRLRSDFGERVAVLPEEYEWVDSPVAGVERMMLDRIGDEVARATSIVRYAPDSTFPTHAHGGGEEILVLDGEFADEHGRYPAGTYLRNPIGTRHRPSVGPQGATLFVKLHQFDRDDTTRVAFDTKTGDWRATGHDGIEVLALHRHGSEIVELYRFTPGSVYPSHPHDGGEEILVIEGAIHDEFGSYAAGSWIRYPDGSEHSVTAGDEGALLYAKSGHLPPPSAGVV